MTEEKGPFGILPQGPIRKALMQKDFHERKTLGVLAANSDELRNFRRSLATGALMSIAVGASIGSIVANFKAIIP